MVTTRSGIASSPSHPQLIRKKKTKSTSQTESISGNKKPGSHKHTKKRNSAHVSVPHLDEVSSLQEILKRLKENDLPFVKQGMLYIIIIIIIIIIIYLTTI